MLDADVVVIGSGMGGLTAALALARAGEKVLVLEQHYAPGGWTHSFALDGYRFSPGVHYLGEMQPGGEQRRTYEGLGLGEYLSLFELNRDGYDHVSAGGERFDFCSGKDALLDRLVKRFPSDAKGITEYIDLVAYIRDELGELAKSKGFLDAVTLPYRTRHIGRYGLYTLQRTLADRIKDPVARGILSVQCGDHGMPPSRVPFAMHAAIVSHYLEGAWYPKGGGSALSKAFTRGLAAHGGVLKLQTRVEKILFEGNRAIGVKLADGSEVRAKRVISNADPLLTYQQLVGEDRLPTGMKKKLAKTKMSTAAISLFFAVDADVRKLGLDSGNYWLCPDLDAEAAYSAMTRPHVLDLPQLPGMFLSCTTLKDPSSFLRHHTCEAFVFVPYEIFAPFAGSQTGARPKEYEALKEKVKAKMFATIEQHLPGLSKNVVFSSVGTPLTNRYYVEATQGAIYGTEKSLWQMGPFTFSSRSPFPGLALVGASTLGHGVHGAALSGLGTAAGMLGVRPAELLNAKGATIPSYLADDQSAWPGELRSRLREPSPLSA